MSTSNNFIVDAMNSLSELRPAFNSEADFQHALAWEIHKRNPDYKIRLEYRPPTINEKIRIDLWIIDSQNNNHAIELKYNTQKVFVRINNEDFDIVENVADDHARYDFLKDVVRIEKFAKINSNTFAYAILLTNVPTHWKDTGNRNVIDADFRIYEDRQIHGVLSWSNSASPGSTKDRESSLDIKEKYIAKWNDYSVVTSSSAGKFRYLMIKAKIPQ
ncbi:MAG: hypothetical protein EB830_02965 [Nitrosopumilus sp. H13]|nr:MAG: hypothetical protein EB830_02965 [Nitrosopumilus sp. H13]